jgi:hypothetical protein
MYIELVLIVAVAWAIVELGAAIKRRRTRRPVILSAHAARLQRRHYPSGAVAGFLACLFGVLGILTWGLLFAPLGAVCGSFGFFHALSSRSVEGLTLSTLGAALTLKAALSSPSLWVAVHPYVTESIARSQELAAYILTTIQR